MTDGVAGCEVGRAGPVDANELPRVVPAVFAVFYAAHVRRAVSLAWVLTGSRELAEELVQDVMADAHRRWSIVGAYDQPVQWLRRAVVNRSVSVRRRALARMRGTAKLAAQVSASNELDVRDAQLWATVRRLPSRQCQLVALVYVDGLTLADAAGTLGIAVPTAKTHLARAKARLADELDAWRDSAPAASPIVSTMVPNESDEEM
jgi:RNA polymerase sigma factor (sigma-70 family)